MTDKITIDKAVLQQALDWADSHGEQVFFWAGMKSVDAMNSWSRPMREALAAPQPAQDAVDAERYRWLRSNWFTMGCWYPHGKVKFTTGEPRWSEQPESNIDEAIDAAIQAATGETK